MITARDPKGPWSDPVWLKNVDGIDPSLFFDDDGSAWLVHNAGPQGTPRYNGHTAIWLTRFDPKTLQAVGEAKVIVDAGVDPSKNPVWIEGPHLFKKDGVYYLMAAEGGTAEKHSEVIFRSDKVEGPYVPAPGIGEPDPDAARSRSGRAEPGHLVRSCRSGEDRKGRLVGGVPGDAALSGRPLQYRPRDLPRACDLGAMAGRRSCRTRRRSRRSRRRPICRTIARRRPPAAFEARDEFAGKALGPEWMMMRSPTTNWYRLEQGALVLAARNERLGDGKQPSFVARRQQNPEAVVTTSVRFAPAEGEEAGLAALQNDDYFLASRSTRRDGKLVVQVMRRDGPNDPAGGVVVASKPVAAGRDPVAHPCARRALRFRLCGEARRVGGGGA